MSDKRSEAEKVRQIDRQRWGTEEALHEYKDALRCDASDVCVSVHVWLKKEARERGREVICSGGK